ncbi:hypothetical protein V8C26DRAFT_411602 [Trichoderma gracile]
MRLPVLLLALGRAVLGLGAACTSQSCVYYSFPLPLQRPRGALLAPVGERSFVYCLSMGCLLPASLRCVMLFY